MRLAITILGLLLAGCSKAPKTSGPLAGPVFPEIDPRFATVARAAVQALPFELSQPPAGVVGFVTVVWTYPQFYTTWGTRFSVIHSTDLKSWSEVTNVSLPKYSRNAVWTATNENYSVLVPRQDHDFLNVGVKP